MTQGTSTHGEGLSAYWADTRLGGGLGGEADWMWDWLRNWAGDGARRVALGWRWRISQAAPLRLLALSTIGGLAAGLGLTGWQAVADVGPQLALLIAAATASAWLGLGARGQNARARREPDGAPDTPGRLLAQMHHELRTPLNAVIGFSEAMQNELHGPLGNARYQEYAACISASGGRLLKASEDAIAVATTMSALVANRRVPRRDRLPASSLVAEAWAALGAKAPDIRLEVEASADAVEVDCDWQATSQALQHLLAEAAACAAPGGTIVASGVRSGGRGGIEIRAPAPPASRGQPASPMAASDGLRLILTRALLEMQGASLRLRAGPRPAAWSARLAFPPAAEWKPARMAPVRAPTRMPPRPRRPRLAPQPRGPGDVRGGVVMQ